LLTASRARFGHADGKGGDTVIGCRARKARRVSNHRVGTIAAIEERGAAQSAETPGHRRDEAAWLTEGERGTSPDHQSRHCAVDIRTGHIVPHSGAARGIAADGIDAVARDALRG
jgi:hypothetical protein